MKELTGLDFIRETVRIRDKHTCRKCKKKWVKGNRRFDVHHLDIEMESVKSYSYDKNNKDKMVTLCHKCHLNLHTVKHKMSVANKSSWKNPNRRKFLHTQLWKEKKIALWKLKYQ